MEKRKELIDYILENGKSQTWYELALMFNIRPGHSRKERTKAANDVWRNYERVTGQKGYVFNYDKFKHYTEEFLSDKPSFINKPALEIAKGLWKILPDSLQPKTVEDLEKQIEIVKQIHNDFRKAKVFKISKEQEKLIDIYNEIVEKKETEKRRLFFDIEISPNLVVSWQIGRKINLSTENIVEERKIICICYKWSNDSKIYSLTWDENSDDKTLLKKFSKIVEEADEVIGHNSDNFDIKHVRARCIYHNIPFPIKLNSVDTLKMARQGYKFNSNKLDYIAKFLGVGAKTDNGGLELWKDIFLYNSKESLNKMVEYCKNDVDILEKVYISLQEFSPTKKFKYVTR